VWRSQKENSHSQRREKEPTSYEKSPREGGTKAEHLLGRIASILRGEGKRLKRGGEASTRSGENERYAPLGRGEGIREKQRNPQEKDSL